MTKLNYSKCLYLDVESTCWLDKSLIYKNLHNEIIQIGIVELDLINLTMGRKTNYYIRPTYTRDVLLAVNKNTNEDIISPYCTALTGITYDLLKSKGRSYRDTLQTIFNTFSHKSVIFTWGDDKNTLITNSQIYNITHYKLNSTQFINLGYLFHITFGLQSNISLEKALNFLDLEFEGTPHRALDDAINTCRIHIELLKYNRKLNL